MAAALSRRKAAAMELVVVRGDGESCAPLAPEV